jgi:hypothetical protein
MWIPTDNQVLIDTWLEVSFEKKSIALELAHRARTCARLSNRQRQLLPEIVDHSLSALELLSVGWTKRQALWTGAAARSLYEASVFAAYVIGSESSAERFYQDGLIDIRDIFESLDAQSSSLGGLADFGAMIAMLRAEMAQLMVTNHIPPKRNTSAFRRLRLRSERNLNTRWCTSSSRSSRTLLP